YFCVFFFFQAEDGIRGFHVTGVQTCALPISGSRIRVRDTTGSSPIVTVGAEQLEEIGTATIETYLNALPQLSPSLTKTNNNPSRSEERRVGKEWTSEWRRCD